MECNSIHVSTPFPFVNGKPQSILAGESFFASVTITNNTDEPLELLEASICNKSANPCSFTISLTPNDATTHNILTFGEKLQPKQCVTLWISGQSDDVGPLDQKHYLADFNFSSDDSWYRKSIKKMLNRNEIPTFVLIGLRQENYSTFFKTLLIMEETQIENELSSYNSKGVIPGLANTFPSDVGCDLPFVKLDSEAIYAKETSEAYKDWVLREQNFLWCAKIFYDAQIEQLHLLSRVVDTAQKLPTNILFPSSLISISELESPPHLAPILVNLDKNQATAINMILSPRLESPCLIYGAPGTGKTFTLVQSILQILSLSHEHRILVCAPSNKAADYILETIINQQSVAVSRNSVFRLNSVTRRFEDIDPKHLEFCSIDNSKFQLPSNSKLETCGIIVSTYTSASLLQLASVKRGHFSHVLLDGAESVSEPETMIPLSHLYSSDTKVVLAGDLMQLSPRVCSRKAQIYGLKKSYFERIMESEFYGSKIELVTNYCNDAGIVHVFRNLFYDHHLFPSKQRDLGFLNSVKGLISNFDHPFVFRGVQGYDELNPLNHSLYNRYEVGKVVDIMDELVKSGVKCEEIGVLTPYKQQEHKIRKMLTSVGCNVKVGDVDQFQGQLKKVIIVSTVHSPMKMKSIEVEELDCLGFLSNQKWLNIAITRATSLFVVVGNPHVLNKEPHWSKILWSCVSYRTYKGCAVPIEKI